MALQGGKKLLELQNGFHVWISRKDAKEERKEKGRCVTGKRRVAAPRLGGVRGWVLPCLCQGLTLLRMGFTQASGHLEKSGFGLLPP
jgi:hypothetical protein